MTHPRGLSAEEAAAWEKVAATVRPLDVSAARQPSTTTGGTDPEPSEQVRHRAPRPTRHAPRDTMSADQATAPSGNLDSHWERRLKSGAMEPEFTLDLHGHGLDAAYSRLMDGVAQARAVGARTILLIAGKPRPAAPADRGSRRGAIRAKVLDWLAASEHHSAIAAVRRAHIRHGGEGALYIVLRRTR